jgi:hypothetical protein
MINYYISQFIKKNFGPDLTVDRPVPSRGGPAPGGQRWDRFSFFKFGPSKTGPWTVRDRGLSGFGPDRPGPDRLQNSRDHPKKGEPRGEKIETGWVVEKR